MEKVKIKICCGTSCFVMGAAQIQVLEFARRRILPTKSKSKKRAA